MKKFFLILVCLLSFSFCFAEKKEYYSRNMSRKGEIELAKEDDVNIVSFVNMAIISDPDADMVISSVLIKFETYDQAESFYNEAIRLRYDYEDFASINKNINNSPAVRNVKADKFHEKRTFYIVKTVNYGDGSEINMYW